MTKYRIVATKIEYFEIEVEADNKEDALDFAEENKNLFKFYREEELNILENSCSEIRSSDT
jgi:hypothetical protein